MSLRNPGLPRPPRLLTITPRKLDSFAAISLRRSPKSTAPIVPASSACFELIRSTTQIRTGGVYAEQFPIACALAICFSAMLAQLSAQQAVTSATLGGRVEDTSGGGISGAQIEAQDLARGRTLAQVSDAHGRFQFLYLNPGDYTLTISGQVSSSKANLDTELGPGAGCLIHDGIS